jgi:GNAT superfamily N-acetyltransferase
MGLTFRNAEEKDLGLLLQFVKELAEYERLLDEVVATEDTLREWLLEKKAAGAFFAVVDGTEVGFCVFYYNFSSFVGRAGIFIEDIYVKPEHRGRGHGKAMMREIARIANDRGCGRLEWSCLDWNEPSIRFYLSLGAKPMDEWTVYRMAGDTLKDMAAE